MRMFRKDEFNLFERNIDLTAQRDKAMDIITEYDTIIFDAGCEEYCGCAFCKLNGVRYIMFGVFV